MIYFWKYSDIIKNLEENFLRLCIYIVSQDVEFLQNK